MDAYLWLTLAIWVLSSLIAVRDLAKGLADLSPGLEVAAAIFRLALAGWAVALLVKG